MCIIIQYVLHVILFYCTKLNKILNWNILFNLSPNQQLQKHEWNYAKLD